MGYVLLTIVWKNNAGYKENILFIYDLQRNITNFYSFEFEKVKTAVKYWIYRRQIYDGSPWDIRDWSR